MYIAKDAVTWLSSAVRDDKQNKPERGQGDAE